MSRKRQPQGAPRIEQVRRQIEHWRETRVRRTRMPEPLWAAAVAVAREHGVYAASRGLRVNYDSLKARMGKRCGESPASNGQRAPAFVEIGGPLSLMGGPAGTRIELASSDGVKMVIQLGAGETLDVAGLVRDFWSRRA